MFLSVYQKILQQDFEKLGPSLRFSHGSIAHLKASAIIDVEYGKNIFAGWLNRLSKMPPKGLQQHVILTVNRNEKEETWTRHFGKKIFRTVQYEKDGYMIEKSGMAALKFKLHIENNSIIFIQQQTLFIGIPAPSLLGLKTHARSTESENGWEVSVEVRSPLFGLMLKYNGKVDIEK